MKSSVDAFFSCLVGPLQEPEHQLRNAIIDFLQRWPSIEYATYFDLRFDPEVASACGRLLPTSVPLSAWMEKRIPGETVLPHTGLLYANLDSV